MYVINFCIKFKLLWKNCYIFKQKLKRDIIVKMYEYMHVHVYLSIPKSKCFLRNIMRF